MSRESDHSVGPSNSGLITIFEMATKRHSIFRDLPGYPWLDPCPRCGYRGSCDCTVKERAQAAYPNLVIHEGWQ